MVNNNLPIYCGLLKMERLFIGSKSERVYPIMYGEDGRRFRIHQKGQKIPSLNLLAGYENCKVQIQGHADNLRGHWRLVFEAGEVSSYVQILSDDSAVTQVAGVSTNE
jgi:hypothetical protein